MTGTPVGAPDFQHQAQWVSPFIANVAGNIPANTSSPATGIIPCTQWAATALFAKDTGGGQPFEVDVTWYADSGGVNTMARQRMYVDPNGAGLTVNLPQEGPFMQVTVIAPAGAAANAAVWVWFANNPTRKCHPHGYAYLFSLPGQSVPANTTSQFWATYGFGGRVGVHGLSTAGSGINWTMTLNAVDHNNNATIAWQRSASDTNSNARFNDEVIVPPSRLRLDIFNADTAAHTFLLSVIPDL